MKHISLFSGIGGFDLAAQWAGWDNLASCEINPFGRRHLAYYWPEAYHHDDIKTLTGSIIEHEAQKRYGPDWRADGVILSGGFPCQPYSLAGKRLGKEDERHLWPEMLRVIQEVKPDWIVGENVFGLVNWSDGLVFNEVQTDLETAGYEVQAFVLPACAADAPHRRDRVWIVAHSKGCYDRRNAGEFQEQNEQERKKGQKKRFPEFGGTGEVFITNANGNGQQRSNGKHEVNASEGGQYAQRDAIEGAEYGTTPDALRNGSREGRRRGQTELIDQDGKVRTITTNANGERQQQQSTVGELERKRPCESNIHNNRADWERFPSQSPVCSRGDGFSGKLDGITFSKWRNESIKAAGNAIVPQIAFRIFETINIFTQHNTHGTQFEQTNARARARE